MSDPLVRRLVGDIYSYRWLKNEFDDKDLGKYQSSINKQFSKITKSWTDELHSEWTARMYLSAKMIYSATLLLNSASYARQKNILITEPYLLYYAIFNCSRALNFTHPNQLWKDGELITDSHKKVISRTRAITNTLNRNFSDTLNKTIELTKEFRELFSYRYPADGVGEDFGEITIDNIADKCSVICELTQLTSECFERQYEKNCSAGKYELKDEILEKCCYYSGEQYAYFDREDGHRISRIIRKVKRPWSVYLTMTEGMTEDFMGSWRRNEDCDDDHFDPDHLDIEIFDLP